jgi:hypothetical protein
LPAAFAEVKPIGAMLETSVALPASLMNSRLSILLSPPILSPRYR